MECEVTEATHQKTEAMATYSLCSEVAEALFAALRAGGRELPVLKKLAFIWRMCGEVW
jgi:hypothetical protein